MEAPATFMEQPAIFVERTLAIIKPDAIDQSAAILRFIEDHGFAILQVLISSSYQEDSISSRYFSRIEKQAATSSYFVNH